MQLSAELAAIAPSFARVAKAIDLRTVAYLERYARRMEPALRDAFLAAVRSAKNNITLETLENAIRSINPEMAIREATGGLEFSKMRETLADIVQASGARATESLVRMTGAINAANFNMVNPYAVHYARTSVGNLIREITQTTREGVARVITHGMEGNIDIREMSRQIKTMVGLTSRQVDWVMNYEGKLLESGAIDIDDKVARYADKVLRQRSQTIARTESLKSMAEGQRGAWKSMVDQGFLPQDLLIQWNINQGACKEICEPMDGEQTELNGGYFILPDGSRVTTPQEGHPNCGCYLTAVV